MKLYKEIFKLSGYSNGEITKLLDITYTQLYQFERTDKFSIGTIKIFCKQLNVSEVEVSEIIRLEIVKK